MVWFNQHREKNISIDGKMLQEKALDFAKQLNITDDFRASVGWLQKFKKRYEVSGWRICGETNSVDEKHQVPKIVKNLNISDIYNCNVLVPERTLTVKGDPCHGGRRGKEQLTVLLTTNADATDKEIVLQDSSDDGDQEEFCESVHEESLGGNSQTTMLATVSPSSAHVDETLSTLRYACQARSIVNYAHVNECPHERVIRELRAEVEKLKSVQQSRQAVTPPARRLLSEEDPRDKELQQLRQELRLCKAALREAQNNHNSTPAITIKQELCDDDDDDETGQDEPLCRLPFLVRISAESVHFAAAHHFLQEGVTIIGRPGSEPVPHMALDGSTIQPNHCSIENRDKRLILISSSDADLFVNNKKPKENQELEDGDWLAIGGVHHFRVFKKENLCTRHNSSEKADILKSQNERLQQELKLWKGLEHDTRRNAENNEVNLKQQIEQLTLTAESYKMDLEREQTRLKELQQKVVQLEDMYYKERHHSQQMLNQACEHEIATEYKSNWLEQLEKILKEPPRPFEKVAVKTEQPSEEEISYNDDEEMADEEGADFQQSWSQESQDTSQENEDSFNNSEEQGNSPVETRSETHVDVAKEIKELLGNTEHILDKILRSAESHERLTTVSVLSAVVEQLREVLDSMLVPAKSNLRTPNSQRVSKVVRFKLSESQEESL